MEGCRRLAFYVKLRRIEYQKSTFRSTIPIAFLTSLQIASLLMMLSFDVMVKDPYDNTIDYITNF